MREVRADRLSGRKIKVGETSITVGKKIGEGGSAFVYLVRSDNDFDNSMEVPNQLTTTTTTTTKLNKHFKNVRSRGSSRKQRDLDNRPNDDKKVVLKTMFLGSVEACEQVVREVQMLRRLKEHPNIIQILDDGEGPPPSTSDEFRMYFLLLEYCRGGSLMDLIMKQRAIRTQLLEEEQERISLLKNNCSNVNPALLLRRRKSSGSSNRNGGLFKSKKRYRDQVMVNKLDKLSGGFLSLQDILSIFQQVGTAIAFLHDRFDIPNEENNMSLEQKEKYRKPIIHRDIKPENILLVHSRKRTRIKDSNCNFWHCKICDFGSAVEGRQPLKSIQDRQEADSKIKKSTTQMYRAPEMIDLHMANELTEKTDIWAFGCALYTTAFLKNCFEENANLGILSGNFEIPNDHPYSHQGLIELIQRMLIVNPQRRASIHDVNVCIDALKNSKPLPSSSSHYFVPKEVTSTKDEILTGKGTYAVKSIDSPSFDWDHRTIQEAKKLNPASEAARRKERRRAAFSNDSLSNTDSVPFDESDIDGSFDQAPSCDLTFQFSSFNTTHEPDDHPFITNDFCNSMEKLDSKRSLLSFEESSASTRNEDANSSYDFGPILTNFSSTFVEWHPTDTALDVKSQNASFEESQFAKNPLNVPRTLTFPPLVNSQKKDKHAYIPVTIRMNENDQVNSSLETSDQSILARSSLSIQTSNVEEGIEVELRDNSIETVNHFQNNHESITITKQTNLGEHYSSPKICGIKVKMKLEKSKSSEELVSPSLGSTTCPIDSDSSCTLLPSPESKNSYFMEGR